MRRSSQRTQQEVDSLEGKLIEALTLKMKRMMSKLESIELSKKI